MRKTNVKKNDKVKQKIQSNSGITLVALVVTIIILLILAFISIATLTGENGILGMAKKAKNENENATNDELAKLKQMELMTKEAGKIPDINAEIDGLPAKKTLEELPGYIPIYTPEQFEKIASGETNYAISDLSGKQIGTYNMEPGAKYALMEDLNFSSMSGVKPVKGFTGELEGNGCYIRNVTISTVDNTEDYTNIITGATDNRAPSGLFQTIINGSVKNLAVTDSSFDAGPGGSGTIAGHADNTTINNCYVKNVKLSTQWNSGGIVGCAGNNGINIFNCKAITISGKDVTGMVYVSFGPTDIENCQVISTDSTKYINSGIVQNTKAKTEIKGCKVQDIAFGTASGWTSGGIINAFESTEKITISDCTVKNSTFNGAGGGIVNSINSPKAEIDGCKIENMEFLKKTWSYIGGIVSVDTGKEELKITNCSVKDLKGESRSGILTHTKTANVEIKDCYVENMETISPEVGGIVCSCAPEYDLNGENTMQIENCIVKNLKTRGAFGGIAFYSAYKYTNINNCIVDTIKKEVSNETLDQLGGIIGNAYQNCNISYCKVSNIDALENTKEYGTDNFGGLVGYCQKAQIDNCEVKSLSYNNLYASNSGGAIGFVEESLGIENVNVDNIKINIEKSAGNTGGIVGTIVKGTLKNCNASNINISCKNNGNAVGGIAGFSQTAQISNSNIKNGELVFKANSSTTREKNKHLGGIAGFSSNVQSCTVKNTKIDSSQTSIIGTGGIVGHSSNFADSVIKDCKIVDSEVIGKDATGGICGAVATVINGCTVENSKITSDGKYVGGIQGYGGYRERDSQKSITIENCNVNNTAIKGTQWVDYIQGRNSHKTDSDTDTTTEDTITNCNYDSKTTKN